MSIRFPAQLPRPDRDTYQEAFEESRSRVPMETGSQRQRRRRSLAPRTFTLTFNFSLAQYATFDNWYQNDIKGGSLPFDIELLNDDNDVVWFTVYQIAEYSYAIRGVALDTWQISWVVQSRLPSFVTRVPGTNELSGVSLNTMTNTGNLEVKKSFFGKSVIEMDNPGRLISTAMYGLASNQNVSFGNLEVIHMTGLSVTTMTNTGQLA